MKQVFFSILMCVYNKTEILEKAVNSVLEQSETSWELLILDNSDENREKTWGMLTEISNRDGRIKIFKSSENTGWAKGASILLEQASGKYVTFLAADDFLLPEALALVKKAAKGNHPDILWVGNKYYEIEGAEFREFGESVPFPPKQIERRHAENIKYVMQHVFYNSFFHYENVEFLKREHIDFFDSGYGDCAGMTRALALADKMVILDKAVYGLTANTSQSRGTFYWDGDQYIFSEQWRSITQAYLRDGYFSFGDLRYCAMAILKNELGNIHSMAEGCKCVNRYMNPVSADAGKRLQQIKQILENDTIQEMAQFMGRLDYEQEILMAVEKIFELCPQTERESLVQQSGWLGKFLEAGYCLTPMGLRKKQDINISDVTAYMQALTDPGNSSIFGMGIFLKTADSMKEDVFLESRECLKEIIRVYNDWKNVFVQGIWNGIGNGGELTGNGKVELAAFCKYILDH